MATVRVIVRGMAGNEIAAVTIERSATVRDLKQAIADASGVPASIQRLALDVEVLGGGDVLSQVLPQEEVELTLIKVDKWVEEVASDWRRLRKAPLEMRNDPEVVLQAIESSRGEALKFAGDEVRGDTEVVLAAMAFDPIFHRYATDERKVVFNRDFVLRALGFVATGRATTAERRGRGLAWRWLASELRRDREVVLAAVRADGTCLQHFGLDFRNDPDIVDIATRASPFAYEFVGPALRENRELAERAVVGSGFLMKHVPAALCDDEDFVRQVLTQGNDKNLIFEYASERLRGVRELALLACDRPTCGEHGLKYAAAALREDPEVVSEALRTGEECAGKFIGPGLLENEQFMTAAIAERPRCVLHLPPSCFAHRWFVLALLAAIKNHPGRCFTYENFDAYGLLGPILQYHGGDGAVVGELVKRYPQAYERLSEDMKANESVACSALRACPAMFWRAPKKLSGDKDFLLSVLGPKLEPAAQRALKRLTVAAIAERHFSAEPRPRSAA